MIMAWQTPALASGTCVHCSLALACSVAVSFKFKLFKFTCRLPVVCCPGDLTRTTFLGSNIVTMTATPTPGGALKNILTNNVIRACFQANLTFISDEGVTLANTTVNPPTGAAMDFFQDLIDVLNANYNSSITVQWSLVSSTNVCFDVRLVDPGCHTHVHWQ